MLLVERARSGDGVLEAVEQVGRGVAVDVGEISHALDGVVDPGHLRIQVGQDRVAVCNRLAEAITQPVKGLRGRGTVTIAEQTFPGDGPDTFQQ